MEGRVFDGFAIHTDSVGGVQILDKATFSIPPSARVDAGDRWMVKVDGRFGGAADAVFGKAAKAVDLSVGPGPYPDGFGTPLRWETRIQIACQAQSLAKPSFAGETAHAPLLKRGHGETSAGRGGILSDKPLQKVQTEPA